MAENQHIYAAIDLKSFYASVECVSRKLDTLTTNLVVADVTRSEKTICLAVSPSLKACGIPGRPRLFEVVQKVREVNRQRLADAVRAHKAVRGADGKWSFASSSFDAAALQKDLSLELGYIVAPPRMATYIEYSTRIYQIYLKYVAPEDIHVYSIDEVFIDLTHYLPFYRMTAHELVTTMIREILYTTGITATAGIGTNLYLAKAAMDIVAKHVPADKDGVRIAELDEQTYRQTLWGHTPLTDFWRVGRGYERRLQKLGLNTMGDIALCSCGGPREYYNEDLLYKTFGVNAELLIDHAWGWEPTTIADIKAYKPESSSLGSGQVLTAAYPYEKARLVVREMAEELILNLVDKGLVTDQIDLTIGYDTASLTTPGIRYTGPVTTDHLWSQGSQARPRHPAFGAADAVGQGHSGRCHGAVRPHCEPGPAGAPGEHCGTAHPGRAGGTARAGGRAVGFIHRLRQAGAGAPCRTGAAGEGKPNPAGGAVHQEEIRQKRLGKGHGFAGGRHRHDPQQPDRRA